jgi:F-type H+-transporting ATPase subunit b
MELLAQIATNVLGFFLLVVFLRKAFWNSVLKLLDDRRHRIERGLQDISRSKQELEQMQADYTKRLAQIDEEARAKIQQAVTDGKRIATEIQEEARAQSAAILVKAKDTVELELAKATVTLRDQVAQMTTEAVERVLRQKLDDKTDQRLVESVVDELEQRYARS